MYRLFISFAIIAMLSYNSIVYSQENAADAVTEQLESDIAAADRVYTETVSSIEAKYTEKVSELRKAAQQKLESLQSKIASSDLDEALRIRDKVKEIGTQQIVPPDQQVVAGKTTKIEKLEKRLKELLREKKNIQKQLRAATKQIAQSKSPLPDLAGKWSGTFTNDFPLQIAIDTDGQCMLATVPKSKKSYSTRLRVVNGRVFLMRHGHQLILEHLELLRSGDRLIALGWDARRLDPLTDKPSVTATLQRSNE